VLTWTHAHALVFYFSFIILIYPVDAEFLPSVLQGCQIIKRIRSRGDWMATKYLVPFCPEGNTFGKVGTTDTFFTLHSLFNAALRRWTLVVFQRSAPSLYHLLATMSTLQPAFLRRPASSSSLRTQASYARGRLGSKYLTPRNRMILGMTAQVIIPWWKRSIQISGIHSSYQ
jgi:hypothetical protein